MRRLFSRLSLESVDLSHQAVPLTFLGLVLILALCVRLPMLVSRPLWYDEAFSVLFSQTGLSGMIQGTLTKAATGTSDVHPLLYYSLLWLWTDLFGSSVFAVRALSVLISLILLVVTVLFVSRVFSSKAALLVGVLVALAPFQIHYAQEARMYGLLGVWIMAGAYAIWQGTTRKAWWPWVGFGVTAALAMYTHALAAVFLVPLALTPLWFRNFKCWRKLAASIALALVLYLPWGLQLPGQFARVARTYWIEPPTIATLLQTVMAFISGLPLERFALYAGLFLSLGILTFLGLQLWRIQSAGGQQRRELVWVALLLVVLPIALLFLLSIVKPVYIVRALLPAGVFFLVLLAVLLTHDLTPRSLRIVLGGMLAIAFTLGEYSQLTYRGFPYAPFRQIGDFLEQVYKPGTVILHSNKLTMLPQVYYSPQLPQTYLADPPGTGSDTLALPTQRVLGLIAATDPELAVGDAEVVYFVIFKQEIQDYLDLGLQAQPALVWLQDNFSTVELREWGDLELFIFNDRILDRTMIFEAGSGLK
jgi:uncharacterized membrane protein